MVACSRSRKPPSPSTSKIRGMLAPVRCSISLSESLNGKRNSLASKCPMVLLPAPIGPTRIRFCIHWLAAGLDRLIIHDPRRDEHQQFGLPILDQIAAEHSTNKRQITEEWNLVYRLALRVGENATNHDGFTIADQHLGVH